MHYTVIPMGTSKVNSSPRPLLRICNIGIYALITNTTANFCITKHFHNQIYIIFYQMHRKHTWFLVALIFLTIFASVDRETNNFR